MSMGEGEIFSGLRSFPMKQREKRQLAVTCFDIGIYPDRKLKAKGTGQKEPLDFWVENMRFMRAIGYKA